LKMQLRLMNIRPSYLLANSIREAEFYSMIFCKYYSCCVTGFCF
jgi:hypothetical protein